MIDILIPTYNRSIFLEKNLLLLKKIINEKKLNSIINIIISDNNSNDNTDAIIKNFSAENFCNIYTYKQTSNIGLERNAIFLLTKARAKFVMYLGDDDYISEDYLSFSIEQIKKDENLSCIIPGFSCLYEDGIVLPARNESYDFKKFKSNLSTVCRISNYGHQLSGLITRRAGLLEEYTTINELRNIYPFIFFVTKCILSGNSIYAPKYQVLVSQSNSKDWKYDDSGLLLEIFKNYNIAFGKRSIKYTIACISFIISQPYRLRVGRNINLAFKAFKELVTNHQVTLTVKIFLIFFYIYLFSIKSINHVIKRLFQR